MQFWKLRTGFGKNPFVLGFAQELTARRKLPTRLLGNCVNTRKPSRSGRSAQATGYDGS